MRSYLFKSATKVRVQSLHANSFQAETCSDYFFLEYLLLGVMYFALERVARDSKSKQSLLRDGGDKKIRSLIFFCLLFKYCVKAAHIARRKLED